MGKLNKIVLHWSAGTYLPSAEDYLHYNFMVGKDGKVFKGKYSPSDNATCSDGKYAHHTGGGNTGAIGVALLGMFGFKNFRDTGKYPLTRKQCEAAFYTACVLCKKYGISLCSVITHYEFGLLNPGSGSAGKIDIVYLPPYPTVKANEVGNFIRSKVKWYSER